MRATFLALCLVTIGLPVSALSQECNPSDESQMGMNICADADYKAADAKLNEAYREVMKRMSDDAEGRKLLQTAQRTWIAFRDAECAFFSQRQQRRIDLSHADFGVSGGAYQRQDGTVEG
jgi:uncharacterized protein YecT (DUF1311 family)